jgi:N6-adenosine-specific RNA methylase IME4
VKLPERYSAARKALAACVKVDEVKAIRDKAVAMETYAFQAKDGTLIAEATEIKMRATRRIGELMAEQKTISGRAKAGRPKKGSQNPIIKLEDQGVDKNLAKAARTLAEISAKEFEKKIEMAITLATASTSGNAEVVKLARAERQKEKKVKRAKRQRQLAAKIKDLPDRRYGVILADPGWKFESYSEATGEDRSAANHYTTETVTDIKNWPVPTIAADDCVLYLWATVPMLPEALMVMAAWEFEYKSHFAWDKEVAGHGYWNRGRHELLLIGTKGDPVAPSEGMQSDSVINERKTEHSVKPQKAYEIIEAYHEDIPKIELNRRGTPRDGWDAWGNEAVEAEAEAAE